MVSNETILYHLRHITDNFPKKTFSCFYLFGKNGVKAISVVNFQILVKNKDIQDFSIFYQVIETRVRVWNI